MPKVEKETKKDVTSMQQEIKRRNKVNPGTPTDVGIWEGSTSTKYRWASHLSPTFALGFFAGLTHNVINSKLLIVLNSLSLASQCILKVSVSLSEIIWGFGFCVKETGKKENESLTLIDTTLKNMNSSLEHSLNLQESGLIDWYEDGVGWHYGYRTW